MVSEVGLSRYVEQNQGANGHRNCLINIIPGFESRHSVRFYIGLYSVSML
jgi:hypothetical protein